MIKLICSDLDGTLLTKENTISEKTKAAIKKVKEKGVMFCIATGRMFSSASIFAAELGLKSPIISYNGALIKDFVTKEVYFSRTIDIEVAQKILYLCRDNDWLAQLYVDDILYFKEPNETTKRYEKHVNVPAHFVGNSLYDLQGAPDKILLNVDSSKSKDITQILQDSFKDKVFVTSSNDRFIEIVAPGVNKGFAVESLAASINISSDEVMCIGDSYNDLEMIQYAATSVAMGNANETLKNAASFVTLDNDSDGVAFALEKFVL